MSEQQGRVSREVRGSLFLIGLDRAAKRNAFDSHMIHDLSLALTEYEDDPSLRCAVIFAHGDTLLLGLIWLSCNLNSLQAFSTFPRHKLTLGAPAPDLVPNPWLWQSKAFVLPRELN